jgi:hypothetical protein
MNSLIGSTSASLVVAPGGRPTAVVGFTSARGRIVAIDLAGDREKLQRLSLGPDGQ